MGDQNVVPFSGEFKSQFDRDVERIGQEINEAMETYGQATVMRYLASMEIFPINVGLECLAELYDAGLDDFLFVYQQTSYNELPPIPGAIPTLEVLPGRLAICSRRLPTLAMKIEVVDSIGDATLPEDAITELFANEACMLTRFRSAALNPIKAYVGTLLVKGAELLGVGKHVMFFEMTNGDTKEIVQLELSHDFSRG